MFVTLMPWNVSLGAKEMRDGKLCVDLFHMSNADNRGALKELAEGESERLRRH